MSEWHEHEAKAECVDLRQRVRELESACDLIEKREEVYQDRIAELEAENDWKKLAWGIHERVVKKIEVRSEEDQRFLALALAGEVGELLNIIKKVWRGDFMLPWQEVVAEIADVRIYLHLLSKAIGIDEDAAAKRVLHGKLRDRWPNEYAAAREATDDE